jgi:hypothetical protein
MTKPNPTDYERLRAMLESIGGNQIAVIGGLSILDNSEMSYEAWAVPPLSRSYIVGRELFEGRADLYEFVGVEDAPVEADIEHLRRRFEAAQGNDEDSPPIEVIVTPDKPATVHVLTDEGERITEITILGFGDVRGSLEVVVAEDQAIRLLAWRNSRPTMNTRLTTKSITVSIEDVRPRYQARCPTCAGLVWIAGNVIEGHNYLGDAHACGSSGDIYKRRA